MQEKSALSERFAAPLVLSERLRPYPTHCPTSNLIIFITTKGQDGSPQTLFSPTLHSWSVLGSLSASGAVIEFIIYLAQFVIKGILHGWVFPPVLCPDFSVLCSSPKHKGQPISPHFSGSLSARHGFVVWNHDSRRGSVGREHFGGCSQQHCLLMYFLFSPLSPLITEQTLLVPLGSGRILHQGQAWNGFSRGEALKEPLDLTFPSCPLPQRHSEIKIAGALKHFPS